MEYKKLAALYDTIAATSKRLEKTFSVAKFLQQTPTAELAQVCLLLQGRVFPPLG